MRSELGLKHIQNFIMSDTEELNVGDFDPSTYQHVLPEGAHDFDNYDSEYEEQHPKLGFTDEQVEAEVAKLDPVDKKFYEEYRDFLDTYYRQHGKIIEMPDLIKLIMTGRYPEIPSTTRKEQDELRGETDDTVQKKRDVPAGWVRRGATQKDQENSSRKNWEDHRCHRR